MERYHYGLQALLYTVALHRYLRWRLPGYDPERNLAGVLYLFLRGMTGPDTPVVGGAPCGVFAWRPPPGLVVALSDILDSRDRRMIDAARPPRRPPRARRARRCCARSTTRACSRRPTSTSRCAWPRSRAASPT